MRLAIAQFRGGGTSLFDPFRPDCDPVGQWGMIDLRPNPTNDNGICLVLGKDDTGPIPGALRDLGDPADLDLPVPPAIKTWIENRLGVVFPTATSRRVMLRELLLDLADDDNPLRWKKLRKGIDNFVRAIIAGVELFNVPVVGGGAVNSESFNKANSTTLGPDLTWNELLGDAEVYNNKWRNVSQTADVVTRAEHDVGSADMYVQAKVDYTSWANWAVLGRMSTGAANTWYTAAGVSTAAQGIRLFKNISGSPTQIGSDVNFATSEETQYLWRLECDGSTIRVKVGGSTYITETDTSISSGQRGGLGAYSAATQVRFDEYEQGSLNSPVLINLLTFDIPVTWGTIAERRDLDLSTIDVVTTFTGITYSIGNTQYFNLAPINIGVTFYAPITEAFVPASGVIIGITLQPINIGVGWGTIVPLTTEQAVTHLVPSTSIFYTTAIPPQVIRDASLRAVTRMTARIEILNGDGSVFLNDLDIEAGSISVSLDRGERRTIEITLDDHERRINHNPGGLWYDKILVPYRGITYREHVWEAPLGRFYIDRISEPDFPNYVHISGRDQTKQLLLNKLPWATTFGPNEAPEDVIRTIALNGGVTRLNLEITGKTLGRYFTFERGTSRWEIISSLAEAFGMEVFFDPGGYLVLRTVRDPTTSPSIWTFQTGPEVGNLVRFTKSANDTRLFNHIVVLGQSTAQIPVTGEAENTRIGSPSAIDLIKRRTYSYESNFVTTQTQAEDLATTLLHVMSLESYEMEFESLVASWLEVGEVVDILDPEPWVDQPTRFLLTDLTIPLGLGQMSGTGKRVQLVH